MNVKLIDLKNHPKGSHDPSLVAWAGSGIKQVYKDVLERIGLEAATVDYEWLKNEKPIAQRYFLGGSRWLPNYSQIIVTQIQILGYLNYSNLREAKAVMCKTKNGWCDKKRVVNGIPFFHRAWFLAIKPIFFTCIHRWNAVGAIFGVSNGCINCEGPRKADAAFSCASMRRTN